MKKITLTITDPNNDATFKSIAAVNLGSLLQKSGVKVSFVENGRTVNPMLPQEVHLENLHVTLNLNHK
jgi:hypothetical protein